MHQTLMDVCAQRGPVTACVTFSTHGVAILFYFLQAEDPQRRRWSDTQLSSSSSSFFFMPLFGFAGRVGERRSRCAWTAAALHTQQQQLEGLCSFVQLPTPPTDIWQSSHQSHTFCWPFHCHSPVFPQDDSSLSLTASRRRRSLHKSRTCSDGLNKAFTTW